MAESKYQMNRIMVQGHNIFRKYGKVQALSDISFEVMEGEIFGVIGPDGAGKTTLFRILTTLLLADQGQAMVNGFNVVEDYTSIRKKIGYMPGKFSLYQDLTVQENLDFFATVFNTTIKENYHLIRDIYVQLEPFKNRRAGALSGGMKQKLALCCALIHKPEILFLDEPTTGVDPVSRREFWEMLGKLKAQGITIIVSTPYMDEAEKCDRIALIQGGSFIQIDTPENIKDGYANPLYAVSSESMYALLKDLRSCERVKSCYPFGDAHHVTFFDDSFSSEDLENFLQSKGHNDNNISKIRPTIEDCFMNLSSPGDAS
jgi:ABC-2 type transport system ATP-binding protein